MSDMTNEPQDGEAKDADRRQFLTKSGLMLALIALSQGADPANAAAVDYKPGTLQVTTSELHAMDMALNDAIKGGRVDPKSPAFGKLSPALQKSFLALTPSDLNTLRAAQAIVQSHFQLPNAADNNGTIGM